MRLWNEVGDARRSHLEQASSSVPKVKEQTDVKSSNSQLSMVGKMKISSSDCRHHPVCRGYRSGNRCICGIRCLHRHAEGASARGTQGAVAILRDKRVQGCVSQNSDPMNSILWTARELGLNASAGPTMKFLGCTWYELQFGEKRTIWRHYPKR